MSPSVAKKEFASVIIPAFNSADTLGKTLSSILASDFPKSRYEVIVVDNGSTDSTVEIARNFPVKTVTCKKPGAAAAMNKGIAVAKGDIICITESDCIVPSSWLESVVSRFEKNPGASGVGGLVLPHKPATKLERLNGEIYVEDQNFPVRKEEAKYLQIAGTLYNANSAYRKETLESVKGFDEDLLGFYDVDLCWRLVAKGRKLVFDPTLRLYHVFPTTLQELSKQYFKWGKWYQILRRKYARELSDKETLKGRLYPTYDFAIASVELLLSKFKEKHMLKIFVRLQYYLGRLAGCKACT